MARPGRGLAFWAAAGGSGLIALTLVNLAAVKFGPKVPGLVAFDNFLTRRNG